MNKITIGEIIKATKGKLVCGDENGIITGVSTDSRKCSLGDVFFPIIGEVHDAHKFIPQVIENGCRTIVVSKEAAINDQFINSGAQGILVEDTTRAIQDLAQYYLKKLNLKTVAVTGSVGKTSTRDMMYYVMSEKYKTGKTEGNFNNDIGVPLTIFTFDDSLEGAVLETGMDHLGEIHRLVEIIRPDIGIITNVGISHIENIGSREGILKAKLEITDYFTKDNSLIVNSANDMLEKAEFNGEYQVVRAGSSVLDDYYVHDIKDYGEKGIDFKLTFQGKEYQVALGIPGAHNAINATLAIGAGYKLGIPTEMAINGLKKLKLTGKRLTIINKNDMTIIDDTYNAAPDSMKSALNTLKNTEGKRKIAILGGMNELGVDSPKYHREVGEYAGKIGVDILIAVGPKAADIAAGGCLALESDKVIYFQSKEDLFKEMKAILKSGDVILLKASRSMEMEEVVERIINE